MRRLVVSEFVSLDGVMEDPRWTFEFQGDHMLSKSDELFASDVLLLGRVTYEGFAAAWPDMKMDPMDYADKMNGMRKVVASTTLTDPKWNNTKVIKEDVAGEVGKLKAESGKEDVIVYGSATLVNFLAKHDLVDAYRLLVYPVVLGKGKKLFQEGTTVTRMNLLESKRYDSGVVLLRYERRER